MTRIHVFLAIALVCGAAACSSAPGTSSDAGTSTDSGVTGTHDAGAEMGPGDAGGSHDAGMPDSGSEMGPGDAGVAGDAGGSDDAGMVVDAGSDDAGTTMDAGNSEDAGTEVDAGSPNDAGMEADAGATDAGSSSMDAGSAGGPGMDGGSDSGGVTQTTSTLNHVKAAMSSFHSDTGGWPLGSSAWYGAPQPWASDSVADLEAAPGQFLQTDTALITRADYGDTDPNSGTPLPACMGSPHTQPCWSGPYLMGDAQSLADVKDAWGHTLLFAYYGSFNNGTGTSPLAPDGAIVIWSAGPNGLDDTGCTETEVGTPTNCVYNEDSTAQGTAGGDDLLMVVSTDVTSFN